VEQIGQIKLSLANSDLMERKKTAILFEASFLQSLFTISADLLPKQKTFWYSISATTGNVMATRQ
jgi:hypothetical protein